MHTKADQYHFKPNCAITFIRLILVFQSNCHVLGLLIIIKVFLLHPKHFGINLIDLCAKCEDLPAIALIRFLNGQLHLFY